MTEERTEQDDRDLIEALQNSIYVGAKEESIRMVVSYCRAARLDPITKPVHIVPTSVRVPGTNTFVTRDVVMPGIELYRIKAHRTGRYAGCSDVQYGPTILHTFKDEKGVVDVEFPEWAKVTVYRILDNGVRAEFTATARWMESYATKSAYSTVPNKMWLRRKFGQLDKCAEASALRKGFPEEVGAQPTREEMEGKVIDEEEYTAIIQQQEEDKRRIEAATTSTRIKQLIEKTTETTEEPDGATQNEEEDPDKALIESIQAAPDRKALQKYRKDVEVLTGERRVKVVLAWTAAVNKFKAAEASAAEAEAKA